jgi:hypothetical protein
MNLQGCEASDAKTLQSQNSQNTKIRILLSALRVIHGRLCTQRPAGYELGLPAGMRTRPETFLNRQRSSADNSRNQKNSWSPTEAWLEV